MNCIFFMNCTNFIDFYGMLQYNIYVTFKIEVMRCSYENER